MSVWKIVNNETLRPLLSVELRHIDAVNDHVQIPAIHSLSQALTFHPFKNVLATRTANSAVAELTFGEHGMYELIHATRLHGDEDLVTLRYTADGTALLSGSIRGEVALSQYGAVLQRWRFGDRAIHWFEPLGDEAYLLASDMRYVVRLDIRSGDAVIGPQFTRDDLEHVCYSPVHGYAVVTGFDKNIYSIGIADCVPHEIIYTAAFKCRWASFCGPGDESLLYHSFNGGLYKLAMYSRTIIAQVKETPDVIWTGAHLADGRYLFAGEGDRLLGLVTGPGNAVQRVPSLELMHVPLRQHGMGYIKRIVAGGPLGEAALVSTSGDIFLVDGAGAVQKRFEIPGVIRDAAWSHQLSRLLVCTEAGNVFQVDVLSESVSQIFASPRAQPLWAIAVDDVTGRIAVAERRGKVCFIDPVILALIDDSVLSVRPKRIKWDGAGRLLLNLGDKIDRYWPQLQKREPYLPSVGNTIEDFAWDAGRRYLVAISYRTDIYLCDFASGELLHTVADQIDYSKGVLFLTPQECVYPLHFVTFGRSGSLHLFRIHNERIHALGPIATL